MCFKPLIKELFLSLLALIAGTVILNLVTGDSGLIDVGMILTGFGVVGSMTVLVHLKDEPEARHGWFMAAPFAFIFFGYNYRQRFNKYCSGALYGIDGSCNDGTICSNKRKATSGTQTQQVRS